MKTRFITILAAVFSCCTALHAQVIDSGKLSGDQSWTLTADGTLTISGTGKVMDDLINVVDIDWLQTVRHIVFEEGITGIGSLSYWTIDALPSMTLPSTIQTIETFPYSHVDCIIVNAETPPYLNLRNGTANFRIRNVIVPAGKVESYRSSDWATLNGREVRFIERTDNPVTVSVNVSTPGTLAGEIAKSGHTAEEIGKIAVSGTPGDEDFAFLRDGLPNLLSLDLSAISATSLPVALFKDKAMLRCLLPKSLTSIPDSLFHNACVVEGISIPSGVTSIGNYAFAGGNVLYGDYAQVIPSGLESFGEGAFQSCRYLISKVTIPDGMTDIPDRAFSSSNISGVTIPESVITIGDYAFSGCGLTEADIQGDISSIGKGAFFGCGFLTKVSIPDATPAIGDSAFYACAQLTDFFVPNGVGSVGDHAFCLPAQIIDRCNPSSISLSDLIIFEKTTYIGAHAFLGSDITSVTIPESVTRIGDGAFYGCSSLTSVTVLGNITEISNMMFSGCSSLSEFSIPESVTSIRESAFYGCSSLTSISIPEGVASIGERAFSNSGLTGITVPGSVAVVGADAFRDCSRLKKAVFAEGVKSIGGGTFGGCSALTSVHIPEGVTIEESPFGYTYSGDKYEYPLLESLIIRSDIDEKYAAEIFDFASADSLRVIEVPAGMLNMNRDDLGFTRPAFDSVTVTAGTLDYKGFEFLTLCRSTLRYINLSKAENTELPDEALAECYRADSIALPANLERVGYAAFRGCMALKSIDIPASVSEIDDNAFEDCRSITAINFGGTEDTQAQAGRTAAPTAQSELRRIGNWAFYNCHQLQHLVIPEGVTEIGDAAFYGCTYLEDLELPSTVTRIGDNCFALCSKLKQIRVRAAVPPEIEAKMFFDVNREIPVYVPEDCLDDYREDPYWREFNLIGEEHGGTVGTDRAEISELYRMEDGRIVLTEEMPVSVYAATGALVYSGTTTEVALPAPGVYILRIGGETVKVVRP